MVTAYRSTHFCGGVDSWKGRGEEKKKEFPSCHFPDATTATPTGPTYGQLACCDAAFSFISTDRLIPHRAAVGDYGRGPIQARLSSRRNATCCTVPNKSRKLVHTYLTYIPTYDAGMPGCRVHRSVTTPKCPLTRPVPDIVLYLRGHLTAPPWQHSGQRLKGSWRKSQFAKSRVGIAPSHRSGLPMQGKPQRTVVMWHKRRHQGCLIARDTSSCYQSLVVIVRRTPTIRL
ncbi:hypothetical protein F4780DRAFT_283909 [Xylariomycetidae sp. FL0641]|nr:hypothetical protein F4780DRAFT_283909 [Xylariomycetidae sp. FL0641]